MGTTAASLDSKITDLKDRITRMEGQSTGRKDFWGYIIGAVGLIATVIAIVGYFIMHK